MRLLTFKLFHGSQVFLRIRSIVTTEPDSLIYSIIYEKLLFWQNMENENR